MSVSCAPSPPLASARRPPPAAQSVPPVPPVSPVPPVQPVSPVSPAAVPSGAIPRAAVAVTPEVVEALWLETRAFREALHRQDWSGRCDARLVPAGDSVVVGGGCVCRDYLVDVLVDVGLHLDGRTVRSPAAAARVHLRTKAKGEWIRRRRLTRGAQARTDRIRAGELGRRLPDDYHRALLEYLVDEAGLAGPLEGHEALVRRLTDRAAEEFGGEPDDHRGRVEAALAVVEAAGRAGRRIRTDDGGLITWWERYVEIPLGRRPRLTDARFAVDTVGGELAGNDGPAGPRGIDAGRRGSADLDRAASLDGGANEAEAAVDRRIVAALANRPGDVDPPQWVVSTVQDLARAGLLPAAVARGFAADRERVTAAVSALGALVAELAAGPGGHDLSVAVGRPSSPS